MWILIMPCIVWFLWLFASSSLSRVGADECRPMTFENGGICRKMRRYHLLFPRSNVAGSTAIPLTLGLARPSYPTSVYSEVEGILAYYPCLCVMRYHDYAETNNAPIFPCACQRLDVSAVAGMSVWKRDALKTPIWTVVRHEISWLFHTVIR